MSAWNLWRGKWFSLDLTVKGVLWGHKPVAEGTCDPAESGSDIGNPGEAKLPISRTVRVLCSSWPRHANFKFIRCKSGCNEDYNNLLDLI